jgi:hypothetical protein
MAQSAIKSDEKTSPHQPDEFIQRTVSIAWASTTFGEFVLKTFNERPQLLA